MVTLNVMLINITLFDIGLVVILIAYTSFDLNLRKMCEFLVTINFKNQENSIKIIL